MVQATPQQQTHPLLKIVLQIVLRRVSLLRLIFVLNTLDCESRGPVECMSEACSSGRAYESHPDASFFLFAQLLSVVCHPVPPRGHGGGLFGRHIGTILAAPR